MVVVLWKKIWHFIWKEESLASWIANVILAFVLIKFIVYPGLGFLLGTGYPIVAVVSGSMEHDGSFDQWWNSSCGSQTQMELYKNYRIDKDQFTQFQFRHGFDKGDIMIVKDGSKPKIGQTIIYTIPEQSDPIIHRVVDTLSKEGHNLYKTKGDHNCGVNAFEEAISPDQIVGMAIIRVPWLGWVKLAFMNIVWGVSTLINGG